jgi:predicted membrane channel-forming protein YqfA (hemolysin III family)
MVSKTAIIINILILSAFIVGLALSSYTVGKEEQNRTTDKFLVSASFLSVTSVLTIVSIISLVVLTALFSGGVTYSPENRTVSFGTNRPQMF